MKMNRKTTAGRSSEKSKAKRSPGRPKSRAGDVLRASEERFYKVFEDNPAAMIISNPAGQITLANSQSHRLFGYAIGELIGMNIEQLVPENVRSDHARHRAAYNRRPSARGMSGRDLMARRKDGTQFPVEIGLTSLMMVEGAFILASISDLTERKQAEEKLRGAEARYRTLVEQLPIVVYVNPADDISSTIYVSPQIKDFLGYTPEEWLGDPIFWSKALHPEDRPRVLKEVGQINETGEPFDSEYRMIARDGHVVWIRDQAILLRDSDARPLFWQGMMDNVTDRKLAEERLNRQNQRLKVLREIDTAILAADLVENIVGAGLSHICELIDCRAAAMTLFDWETNEMVVFDVRTASETSVSKGTRMPVTAHQNMIPTLSNNQPVVINELNSLPDPPPQIQVIIKEGLRSLCILPLFSQGSLIGSFSMSSEHPGFFDAEKIDLGREVANQVALAITQSNLLKALREYNTDLADRAIEREKLIAELTDKNAEMEHFIYTVSHDLKAPLVTMKGYLGYLEQDARTGNMERLKGDSRRISNAVEKMQELLSDLLELSRIGRFVNPPEVVPFDELAHKAIGLVEGRIQERGVTVEIQPDLPVVWVDKLRLIEVLQNLIDNAVKYMGDEPEPRIEIGRCGNEGGAPLFYVKDNGIGIEPEFRERIFGLFNKLDAHSEGTGIGLALVRRIIEFHGGRIWVESKPGHGSAFCFTLPVQQRPDSVI